jgi:hypothetical protein
MRTLAKNRVKLDFFGLDFGWSKGLQVIFASSFLEELQSLA